MYPAPPVTKTECMGVPLREKTGCNSGPSALAVNSTPSGSRSKTIREIFEVGEPYYKTAQGLKFKCTRCGNCCTRPGPVFFTGSDLPRAAEFLGLTPEKFVRRYRLRDKDGAQSLDPGPDQPCPLYDPSRGCTIYKARPTQCRTWPFWPEVARQKRSWNRAARDCPGMDQGPRIPPTEIERSLDLCGEMGLPEGDPW